jgi:hypothetical protein
MAVRNIKLAVKRKGVLLGILPELWPDQKSDADIQRERQTSGGKHDHIPNAITPALTVPNAVVLQRLGSGRGFVNVTINIKIVRSVLFAPTIFASDHL